MGESLIPLPRRVLCRQHHLSGLRNFSEEGKQQPKMECRFFFIPIQYHIFYPKAFGSKVLVQQEMKEQIKQPYFQNSDL